MRLLCDGQLYFHDIYSSSFSFRLPPPSSCSSMLWFVVVVAAVVVVDVPSFRHPSAMPDT